MEIIFGLITIIGFLLLGGIIYFTPSIVAYKRKHRQENAILILNIFLGWTFVGWVICLVWSFIED